MYEEIKKTRDENYLTCSVTAMYKKCREEEGAVQSKLSKVAAARRQQQPLVDTN